MDARDKLSLTQPAGSFVPSNVITPDALSVINPFRNFVIGPTASPVSRRLPILTMKQQQQDTENSNDLANIEDTISIDDTKDKAALSFILSSSDSESDTEEPQTVGKRKRGLNSTSATAAEDSASNMAARKGSKFCSVEGCTSRAKHAKRCWKHGGWVRCKVPDCNNRAKSKGVCWSHGGGTVCSFENCDTISVSNGFCWAHGGGKRCQVPNCSKPAYERTLNYCQTHFEVYNANAFAEET
ncbi:hypothetical protein BBO99_00005091 [Phytophthora kernoviae]|uniref:WRKY19-like zinc finger domain-containing protein n=2 Tax=Phytophthora kernoviae TaxID=325452 RepID=A0A3R7KU24_9STRA|nr:hypothetical protein G195_005550 [Phytophthora kernoviae 00238/432]KAG2523519.1 hypothetical protein JM16_004800 [Phytophthora kernoviae]KAG2525370.1 hypothetical protein JM18_004413 [Phytophthora kernoviae]RLN21425.1 hypothetical protein BBI17_005178 [Phytophthora kernoviae]RLN79691.1 hypothetical protein BBO99_00005091 [Phytophthora kernoviae]